LENKMTRQWELHDAIFSIEHMDNKIRKLAADRNMPNTLKALDIMNKYHEGEFRRCTEHIPYVIHPLMMACHAFALGIADDVLIPVCLLHDVLEDTEATPSDLQMPDEITNAVRLLTRDKVMEEERSDALYIYYDNISRSRIASIVKLLDRCNNISTMATAFSAEKMAEYIDETEKYLMPLLDKVKHEYDEYYNTTFILKYHMKSVIESLKRII